LAQVLTELGGLNRLKQAADAGLFTHGRIQRPDGPKETLMLDFKHPLAEAAYRLVRWAPSQVNHGLQHYGYEYVDTRFMTNGMPYDQHLKRLGVGQDRREAEQWLELLGKAGVLEEEEREHPKVAGKFLTTWWVPGERPVSTKKAVRSEQKVTPVVNQRMRQLVADALSDGELTELAFDYFRPVYEQFSEGMAKGQKARLLIEYAERQNLRTKLVERLQEKNPGRSAELTPQAAA
jgi:hypothetical protein